jgi:hypothetical protein
VPVKKVKEVKVTEGYCWDGRMMVSLCIYRDFIEKLEGLNVEIWM